jgi:colanic acid/amylovoran biosynthesis glycosyltransferase
MVDGASGYLVQPGDAEGLADRLLHLIEHPDIWPAMGAAGRRHVELSFDVEQLNDRLVRLYEHVATGRPAGAFARASAVRT